MEEVVIRDNLPEDESFILDSWLKSYYGASFFTVKIPKSVFFSHHSRLIKKLLVTSRIRLAVDPQDLGIIAGYIVYEPDKIHYLYVKESLRGFGIGKKLLSEANLFDRTKITHLTKKGRKIQLKMGFVYAPYFE